jgi:glyceraldehyde-3-phosphate dehydrogenase (ferredoxin)
MVAAPEDIERATIKYRYHPQLKTGGTFGSNFTNLREKMLAWNARSVLQPPEERLEAYERLVERHYLRQFNEEIVARGRGRDCGETCPAVCKKVSEGHKKDYQPYAALGPNIGVFDHRAAERVNAVADGLGFDSVEAGGLVGWAFELVSEGLARPADLGMPAGPRFDARDFDPVADSAHNADLAGMLLRAVVAGELPLPAAMRGGLRAAARSVGGEAAARALYVANGEDGSVCPNQYWVPGMLAPVPVSGKYYVDYAFDFRPPRELGRSCAARMIREIGLDNVGLCRFQREWAEPRMNDLLRAAGWAEIGDVDAHHRALSRAVARQADPRGLETRRARELLAGWMAEAARDDVRSPELDAWSARFGADPAAAADAWWSEMRAGIADGLASEDV